MKETVVLCFGIMAENVKVTKAGHSQVTMKDKKGKDSEAWLPAMVLNGSAARLRKDIGKYVAAMFKAVQDSRRMRKLREKKAKRKVRK